MKQWLNNLKDRIGKRLEQAYGPDQLGAFLLGLACACLVVSRFWGVVWTCLSAALLCYALWRTFSKNTAARRRENEKACAIISWPQKKIRRAWSKWKNRKEKAYVRCPNCHEEFALPKGKGKLRATCPRCGEKSIHTV